MSNKLRFARNDTSRFVSPPTCLIIFSPTERECADAGMNRHRLIGCLSVGAVVRGRGFVGPRLMFARTTVLFRPPSEREYRPVESTEVANVWESGSCRANSKGEEGFVRAKPAKRLKLTLRDDWTPSGTRHKMSELTTTSTTSTTPADRTGKQDSCPTAPETHAPPLEKAFSPTFRPGPRPRLPMSGRSALSTRRV